jgi:multidrug efflux pump subunit AcrA (membrane-fusion protein)
MDSVDKSQTSERDGVDGESRGAKGVTLSIAISALLILVASVAAATHRQWLPFLQGASHSPDEQHVHSDEASSEDAHSHEGSPQGGHGDDTSLKLSEQGRKNIGLTLETVALSDFERTIAIPATLVERQGQTKIVVSAPMTGIVTGIHPIRGEAVTPGAPLFDLRLTHEDLVEKQSSLLRSLEELDVVKREVARLEDVTATGAVAGKRLLEQEYEQHKIEASIRAERQALLLHGLLEEQIQKIVDERQLQHRLTISVPELHEHAATEGHEEFLQVSELAVSVGEHVQTGVPLATLADHCELYIEGRAFEHDADALNQAANEKAEVTAIVEGSGGNQQVGGLRILHVENEVERESRALKFYILLPNELVRNELTAEGHRFIGWRFKPGQRVEVRIPVETWKGRIVLPVTAVIEEGPERYVYQEVQGRFQRRTVHVEYRDQRHAVIESDGTLFPGDQVAAGGAHQIHLAVKNQAGGGPDPHAGHHH